VRNLIQLSVFVFLTAFFACADPIPVFSTGANLPGGSRDPHWNFSQGANGGPAFVLSGPNLGSEWVSNGTVSEWIAVCDCINTGAAPEVFTLTFDMTGLDPTTAQITGQWTVDDAGTIALNGQVVDTAPDGSWGGFRPFTMPSTLFVPGINTITATITFSDNGYEGVNVDFLSATATPVPAPPFPITGSASGQTDAFQIGYAANLGTGDSVVNITNAGATGNLCVNVYAFDPGEEMLSCCGCKITPNGLASLSVNDSVLETTFTGEKPSSVVIDLLATNCAGQLSSGMLAWGTTPHTWAGGTGLTENAFAQGSLSQAELNHLTSFCGFIQTYGGSGVCAGCSMSGL
jgi:hypothetical protein